ncbi:hypothetical protein [Streptomyces acidiscabies]|uniref:Uncharacterized protein n=1 Tax=Streptomyces acidiscabies TaxID=42234 RepID=A0AAP6ELF5_9ACTN|nr:hypothetical protein [Streptomyces acidiscabies]MBP5937917.1 hypothetical protein [Streptomyces sp. LBUM 1476]MBZ3908918.1 hypothetical protein [Streptomyces acidiscabies]MDX2966576.1 hypothetical protein [Streptomyces acidiscabies]MDX3016675.1 hypothetical protein [Streptomyces acidiscabies]MDX3788417.1 hypothetical protein [Streptomyces acidiscabies]
MTEAPPLYSQLGALYERELNAHGVGAVMLTHKWQPADLLAPHSDIDVRVLLPQAPADWEEWNHRLAAAHSAAIGREVSHRRLLEHPPGFAFTTAEADGRLVSSPELSTWSLISGNTRDFQRWKSRAQMAPWCEVDERFYRGILRARLGGRYQLAADSTDNVAGDITAYQRHCVAWHYLAPCWFAAAALATRTRCPGKTAALTQWRPEGLDEYAELILGHSEIRPGTRPRSSRHLLRTAHVALEAVMRRVPDTATTAAKGKEHARVDWMTATGMLRVRVARWLYYLDPPPGMATDYLIRREAKELRAATQTLNALAADDTTPAQRLAARMAVLIPTGPTTADVLRTTLALWHRQKSTVQEFLSLTPRDIRL